MRSLTLNHDTSLSVGDCFGMSVPAYEGDFAPSKPPDSGLEHGANAGKRALDNNELIPPCDHSAAQRVNSCTD